MAQQPSSITVFIFIFLHLFPFTTPATFSFTSFSPNDRNISTFDGASVNDNSGTLRLNNNEFGGNVFNNTGRAQYTEAIQLWDPATNATTDFTTYFEFSIQFQNGFDNSNSGGFAFFLASPNSRIPLNSGGGWLGLFNQSTNGSSTNQIVAVEFDTFQDAWDPSNNHVGIDVNSIVSEANQTWSNTMVSGDILGARISYNGTTNDLHVHLKDPQVPNDTGSLNLTYKIDLKTFLPEKVIAGFSASSGSSIVTQLIRRWNFTSSLDLVVEVGEDGGSSKMLVVGLIIGAVVLILGLGLVLGLWWRKANIKKEVVEDLDFDDDDPMDDDFEKGTGPKRFSYKELVLATNNFAEEGKLGEGGFGGVYKGFLTDLNLEIAAKKISRGSKQGKKEYVSEVKIISRLRHKNLVQLLGWSHERREFLLVYEFMPNGSLDTHLFGKKSSLTWTVRYKIALGLSSALLYLHEEWEQCVVHRDIKSSNVMLDSSFNAKLGDFGLARLVDHDLGLQTTVLAGTMGYLAPECIITGKASKESDVFSFGVVALEIGCGRRPVEPKAEESQVRLVEWVWELYGKGRLLQAVDPVLMGDFDEKEMECLMTVGLWCAHPDHSLRPSIRQAIQVLNFEAPLPNLPPTMPVPTYFSPSPVQAGQFSLTFSSDATNGNDSTSVASTATSSTLNRVSSSKSLLHGIHSTAVI
ncbi:L-type lectin-domain containing receptor kinase IX.1-like [Magnolia sinica]|uniref:L-type lectin-domain containing receptor kinase IX.1-like n=1 Tax=Magnolia sinica TaxID=86752 RepID=UPI0026594D10|nr:L-type lectin-domain containing receptor kinase IX.1-like [Magnolia sinica]